MQYAHRNSGPGFGAFFLIATAAFALVFALGLLRPSGSVNAYDRIQRLAWQFSNLRAKDFSFASLTPSWLGFGMPSATPASQAPAGKPSQEPEAETTYRVEAGDSLSRIAARFDVELDALVAHNRLADPDLLEVGQTLRIPSDGRTASEVAPVTATAPSPPAVSSGPSASATVPLVQVDALLAMADEEISDARFERALHTSVAVERLLGTPDASDGDEIATRRARMELIRATAHTAVGNHEQVQQALARALAADPELKLDPAHTSPKLLTALDVAREIRASESADLALGD